MHVKKGQLGNFIVEENAYKVSHSVMVIVVQLMDQIARPAE